MNVKRFFNTKGSNDSEVEQSLIDFLHYVAKSSDDSVSDDCDAIYNFLNK